MYILFVLLILHVLYSRIQTIEIDVGDSVESTYAANPEIIDVEEEMDWVTDCNWISRQNCSELHSLIEGESIDYTGIDPSIELNLMLMKFKEYQDFTIKDHFVKFCERYQDREKMLGEGTRKPVNILVKRVKDVVDVEVSSDCSVPCRISQNKSELVGGVDVVLSKYYYEKRRLDPRHFRKRPYRAVITHESIYNMGHRERAFEVADVVDLLIHHHPYSDIPYFVGTLSIEWGTYSGLYEELEMFGFKYDPKKGSKFKEKFMEVFKKKKRDVLGVDFISRCTVGRERKWYRRRYLEYIQSYIPTDNYGSCGANPREEVQYVEGYRPVVNKAMNSLPYKFFFCFENTRAYNYMTEKLPEALALLYILPVYSGAQNVMEYFGPEQERYKFFVNADDFEDPKELVEYLNYLDRNDTAYLEYFQWRFDGVEIKGNLEWLNDKVDGHGRDQGVVCRLCEKIYYGEKFCHYDRYPQYSFPTNVNLI